MDYLEHIPKNVIKEKFSKEYDLEDETKSNFKFLDTEVILSNRNVPLSLVPKDESMTISKNGYVIIYFENYLAMIRDIYK